MAPARAAHWRRVGQTTGRGRTDLRSDRERVGSPPPLPIKALWVYPPGGTDMTRPGMLRLSNELAALDLGDARLNQRACALFERLPQRPDRSIPTARGACKETQAAYRLLDSEEVTARKLLEPHSVCTRERMMDHEVVLCIQDTTELDYTGKNDTQGLGPLN